MGITPVVMDSESTVQEKALECLDQVLLQNIKHFNKFHSGDDGQVLAWALLSLLSTESQELRYVNYALLCLARAQRVSLKIISVFIWEN